MRKTLIFCHGFGFDNSFWDNLLPYFIGMNSICLDLGYFSNKAENKSEINLNQSLVQYGLAQYDGLLIGVGHSLGFSKLLTLNLKFDFLIGLNGFVNFLANEPDLNQKRSRELQVLKTHFQLSSQRTLKNFYKRCGVPVDVNKINQINEIAALNDLNFLEKSIEMPNNIPTLILGSRNDVVVPESVLYDNFEKHSNVHIHMMDVGMHALGFLEADTVFQNIKKVIDDES